MDRFLLVGQLCHEVDQWTAEQEKATSPMLKAKRFERALALTSRLQALQGTLRETLSALELELRPMNAAWEKAPPPGSAERAQCLPLTRVEEIARTWSFLGRWLSQLQERLVQLAF